MHNIITFLFRRNIGDLIKILCMFLPGGRQIMQTAGIPVMKKQETEFFYKVIETTIQQVIEGKQI